MVGFVRSTRGIAFSRVLLAKKDWGFRVSILGFDSLMLIFFGFLFLI